MSCVFYHITKENLGNACSTHCLEILHERFREVLKTTVLDSVFPVLRLRREQMTY